MPAPTGQTSRVQSIGLVGGMSWESSAAYYKDLNLGVERRLGGLHSIRTVMASVEFAEVTALGKQGRWDEVAAILVEASLGMERAGADFLMLCTTTFHRVADQVEAALTIPLLHLADVVADACKAQRLESVAFLGTKLAMSEPFFIDRLASHGLEVHVPAPEHHDLLDRVDLASVAPGRMHPDAFVYDFVVGDRSTRVVGSELPEELRRLAQLVLADDR